jgi:multimeric flavodoxin WrbA
MISIIAVMGSPRRHGNTEKLLDEFIRGAKEADADVDVNVEKIILSDLDILLCKGCNACHKTGSCVIEDDATTFYDKINAADGFVFAFPIFTMSVPAGVKAVIDRAHYIWVRRFVHYSETISKVYRESHHAWFLSTAGMSLQRRPDLFTATLPMMSAFFKNLGYTQNSGIYADAMDQYGGIEGRPDLLKEAYEHGQRAVEELANSPSPRLDPA